jgi:hypothetical protein
MFGFTFLKTVNVKEIYKNLNQNKEGKDKTWLDKYDMKVDNQPNLEFCISDNRDVMVKITSKGKKKNAA